MTITLHYTADRNALDYGATVDEKAALDARYDAYVEYLEGEGFAVDYDSPQTTYCTTGDDWPEGVLGFWDWYSIHG